MDKYRGLAGERTVLCDRNQLCTMLVNRSSEQRSMLTSTEYNAHVHLQFHEVPEWDLKRISMKV